MERSSARVWLAPLASPAWASGWKAAPPSPESLLELVLDDAYAYLEGLERRKGALLDAPAGLLSRAGGSRREGPVRLAGFAPEDVAVQLEGRKLRVTARRETTRRAPDGCCARDYREVSREALLPDDADLEGAACVLGADGQLRVEAPRLPPPAPPERVVPIRRVEEPVGGKERGPAGGAEEKPEAEK